MDSFILGCYKEQYFNIRSPIKGHIRTWSDVNLEDKLIGRSPLHIAAMNDNVEAVELLINYEADVNHKDAWRWTPFNCAAAKGNRKVMDYLIAHGASIETNDPQKTLLSICPYNYLEAATTIIQLGIWKDMMKLMEAEFLRCAAGHGDTIMVCALLESGVNANTSDDLRLTALHKAAKYNHTEVVRILILYGANVNAKDDLGESPLTCAVERRNWIVVITFIELHLSISFEFMIRDQANQIEQLQHNAKLNEKGVTSLANGIERIKLGSNTEACPAEIDGVKE